MSFDLAKALAFALMWLHCGASTSKSVAKDVDIELEIASTSDDDRIVGNVEIFVNYEKAGETDAKGALSLRMRKAIGDEIRIDARCPAGYLHEGLGKVLRARGQAATQADAVQELSSSVTCVPTHRSATVLVRVAASQRQDAETERPPWFQLPVLLNGKQVATTNAAGVAQLAMRVQSDTRFEISLDTANFPELQPQNPSKAMVVGQEDTILVVDESFFIPEPEVVEEAPPKATPKPRERRPRKRRRRRRRPKKAQPEDDRPTPL